jgi:hypothetical protein
MLCVILYKIGDVASRIPDDIGSKEDIDRKKEFERMAQSFGAWWQYLPSSIVLETRLSISLMKEQLNEIIDRECDHYIILELNMTCTRDGWMPQDSWEWFSGRK